MSQVIPVPIAPPPGVLITDSLRVAEGRWVLPFDKMRFVNGKPQKIGGNTKQTTTAVTGQPRTMLAWKDFVANPFIAIGTDVKLYLVDSTFVLNDITPFRSTGTLGTDPFTTSFGSNVVQVTQVANGVGVGDTVIFSGATTFNNVTMNGTFIVQTIIDSSNYTILATTTANAPGTGGGASVTFQYEINVGVEFSAFGQGWGVGPWGLGTWGTPRSGGSSPVTAIEARVWSLDHFGKILFATYNGGTLWTFDPDQSQPWPRAVNTFGGNPMVGVPTNFRAMFITPERFVFGLLDQMTVAWCSQGDPTTWTPATGNTANFRTLTEGTKLVGGRVLAPFVSLVWSDAACYLFQWTGDTYVYRSSLAGKDCGLISPNAVVTVDGISYWMGSDNFYSYSGGIVAPIPTVEEIRKYVFDALPPSLGYQCHAVYIPKYHEIQFFYPTTGSSSPTNYVIYNIDMQIWAPGTFNVVSGTHFTQGDTRPIMAKNDGFIYQFEQGTDDNGSPLVATYTLSPMALQEGLRQYDVEGMLWDFFQQSGNVYTTLNTFDRLTDSSPQDTETDTVLPTNNGLTDTRVSGRYVGFTLTQSDLGTYHRFGKPAAFIRPTGVRR